MTIATGIINCIKRISDIVQDNKNRKAAIEEEKLARNQRAKDCGAKSINLYAEMLSGVKMTEEKVRGKKFKEYCMITESVSREEMESRYPIDKVMGELHDSVDPLKYSKPDITITKEQAKKWLKTIEDTSGVDEENMNILMNELSALIGDDDE